MGPTDSCLLFLDFDGVLQTPALEFWADMEHCAELQALLQRVPTLSLVVTSTHREGRALSGVQALLPPAIAKRVIGVTPVFPDGRAHGGRQREIEDWLHRFGVAQNWVAVDDEPQLFQQDCPWLVTTHKYIGWSKDTTEAVCRALNVPG